MPTPSTTAVCLSSTTTSSTSPHPRRSRRGARQPRRRPHRRASRPPYKSRPQGLRPAPRGPPCRRPGRRVPVLPRPPTDPHRRTAPPPPQRACATRTSIDDAWTGRVARHRPARRHATELAVCSATASCTGCCSRDARPSSTTGRPPGPSPLPVERSGHPRRALPLPRLRPPATWCDGHHVRWVTTAARPSSTTSSCSAAATTTGSTNPTGRPSSCPTPPSRSPTPTAAPNAPNHPWRSRNESTDDNSATAEPVDLSDVLDA